MSAYTTRPETFADLPARNRRGKQLLTIYTKNLPADPAVLRMYAQVLENLDPTQFIREDNYGDTTFYTRLTPEEQEDALRDGRAEWDRAREQYEACLVSGTVPETGVKYRVEGFCRAEAIPLPWAGAE